MRSHFPTISALALAALTVMPASSFAADPIGVWIDDKGRGAIEIKPCGDQLCGHVVWVKNANDKRGCGKQILGDVDKVSASTWDKGWIYSPDRGKKYSVELKMLDNDRLQVTGYAGIKYFSETMIWTKAPSDLNRCEEVAKLAPDDKGTAPAPSNSQPAPQHPGVKADEPAAAPGVEPQSSTPAPQVEKPKVTTRGPAGSDARSAEAPKAPKIAAEQPKATARAAPRQEADDVPLETGPDLSDLPIDKYFNRTADGRCKLNLPWVNVDFPCSRTE